MKHGKKPVILINYKTYAEATGRKALILTKEIERVALDSYAYVAVAPQFADIRMIAENTELPVFAQHVDPIEEGSNTGHVLASCIKEAGAVGTIINHAEKRLRIADIEKIIKICKKHELICVACANTPGVSASLSTLSPNYVAVEPPELIGGDISVSVAKPDVVKGAVDAVKRVNKGVGVLCGAGVKNENDVYRALALGVDGVLLASGVVKAKKPGNVMADLLKGVEKYLKEGLR